MDTNIDNEPLTASFIEALWEQVNEELPVFPENFLSYSGYWSFQCGQVHGELKGQEYWDAKRTFFLLVLAAEGEL